MSVLGTRSTSFSFGQPPAKQPFNFGGSNAGGATGSTLLGQPPATQQQQQPSATPSFSFGGVPKSQTPVAAPGTSSLFGNNNNAPKSVGFSFNQPAATPQQPQQQQTGGLFQGFGQQQQQPQQQQQQQQQQLGQSSLGGSLFGGNNTQNNQQGSLNFGATNNQQQQQPSFSLGNSQPFSFGQSQQQPQQQQPQQFNQSLQGGPQFGQSQAPIQINPASPFAQRALHQKERFNELPEETKKLLEELDSHISSQLRLKDELASKDFGGEVQKRRTEWNDLHNSLSNSSLILQQDSELIKGVVDRVEKDRADFMAMFEITQNFKEGKSDGKQWINWPGEFFAKSAMEFRERITRYRSTMEEISKQLSTIDNRNDHSPELISNVILNQHSTFMSLASNVANLHSELDQLKKDYTQWYQTQYRSVQDPFAMSQLISTI